MPPTDMVEGKFEAPAFLPAADLLEWATSTFIVDGAPLFNVDHTHLQVASLGFLWTRVGNSRNGRTIVGQCEFRPPGGSMGKWQRERAKAQLHDWFGEDLDFLITIDARYAAAASDVQFCALVEHELYHAGQERGFDGELRFHRDSGLPVFGMRAHDVEEFIGVVKRYGAVTPDVAALAAAMVDGPTIAVTSITACCGTCR